VHWLCRRLHLGRSCPSYADYPAGVLNIPQPIGLFPASVTVAPSSFRTATQCRAKTRPNTNRGEFTPPERELPICSPRLNPFFHREDICVRFSTHSWMPRFFDGTSAGSIGGTVAGARNRAAELTSGATQAPVVAAWNTRDSGTKEGVGR